MPNTLAIVGSHPATCDAAPWDNPAVDILVFNEAPNQNWVKRWNIDLQLHNKTIYRNPHNRTDPGHWEWLQKDHGRGKVIYMQDKDPQVPNSKRYPKPEIERDLLSGLTIAEPGGLKHVTPFTNSISFAIALGIYLGYKRLLLFGTEMASNTEYEYQRENVQFWVGLAAGRGVRLELHSGQSLVTGAVYGYDGDLTYEPGKFDGMAKKLLADLKEARKALKGAQERLGLMPINLYRTFSAEQKDKFNQDMARLMREAFEANFLVGQLAGELCIAHRFGVKARTMINQTGDAIISRQEFEQGAAAARQEMERITPNIARLDGQLDLYYRNWSQTGNMEAIKGFANLAGQHHKLARVMGAFVGRNKANTALMVEADKKLKAAGGEKSFEAYKVQLSAPLAQQAVQA